MPNDQHDDALPRGVMTPADLEALEAAVRHAKQSFDRVGYVLAAFRLRRGWSRELLADWLGISADDLARLAIEARPAAVGKDLTYDPAPIRALAAAYGAHAVRL